VKPGMAHPHRHRARLDIQEQPNRLNVDYQGHPGQPDRRVPAQGVAPPDYSRPLGDMLEGRLRLPTSDSEPVPESRSSDDHC
jgi:hypothetical protein